MDTTHTIQRYIDALNAESYKIQLKNRRTEKAFNVSYSPEQLLRAVGFLRNKNSEGFDVYCRPVGYQFVLLDDLTRDILADVAILKPCVLMETSSNNYQVWLLLPEIPTDREIAKAICRELAQQFGADMGSAEPDHVGRLPGFTNRKEKYQLPNGLFPFVRLHRAAYRVSTFHPVGARVLQSDQEQRRAARKTATSNRSISEQDFGKACALIRQGKSDNDIYQYLLENSPDLSQRKKRSYIDRYLRLTIANAHRSVGI